MNTLAIPFVWVLVTLPILLLMERWIHRHLQGLALIITGRTDWAIYLYAIVLFPGVFLHELSHWLMAGLMGVKTGRFSVIPKVQPGGRLQLGFVEFYRDASLGPVRESIIGGAPLIFGTTVICLMGQFVFKIPNLVGMLQVPDVDFLAAAWQQVIQTNDLFLWLYLLFAVSNAMMPSPSDRQAWPLLLVVLMSMGVTLFLLDGDRSVMSNMAPYVSILASYVAIAFAMTIVVDIVFVVLIAGLEAVFGRLSGRRVNYY